MATRTSATLTMIGVLLFGVWLDIQGRTSVGEIVAFMGLAASLVARLDQINGFLFRIFGASSSRKSTRSISPFSVSSMSANACSA